MGRSIRNEEGIRKEETVSMETSLEITEGLMEERLYGMNYELMGRSI